MSEPKIRAARGEVPEAVLKYFGKHIGQDVHVGDMVKDLGFTDVQIRSAVYNLRMTRDVLRRDIIIILSGKVWRYLPRPVEQPTSASAVVASQPATSSQSPNPAPSTLVGVGDASNDVVARVLYERVGELNGSTIVRDEHGKCYRIEPLELQIDIT